MQFVFSIVLTIFVVIITEEVIAHADLTSDEYAIHRQCNHRSKFTTREVEDVKIYLQTRFINGASINPQRPPCKTLKVIPDFRCLDEHAKHAYISAFRKVYNTEFINNISRIHTYYWFHVNILAQTNAWHSAIQTTIQKEVEKFNPTVLMAYWDVSSDGSAPEKALVWDYFGHSGNQQNDYCVPGGPFSGLTLKYPNNTCLKREWNSDGTINRWETPEVNTFILQQGIGSLTTVGPLIFAQHFKKHMYIGGLNGDMGNTQSTNEPMFYKFHWFEMLMHAMKWQLEADNTLVDLTFNLYGHVEPPYSYNGTIVTANIAIDTLLGFTPEFNATTIAEGMTHGFGDSCYFPDRIFEAILSVLSNRRPRYPPAVQRLRDALPSDVFAELFPKFADNTATQLNYHLPDTGNTNRECKPLPLPINYTDTEVGRQQLARFNQIGLDVTPFILDGEAKLYKFIETLNKYNYCSPYVSQ